MLDVKKMLTKLLTKSKSTDSSITTLQSDVATLKNTELKVVDVTNRITMGGAFTQVHKSAYQIGHLLFFTIEATVGTYVGGTTYTIATAASGYRPNQMTPCVGYTSDSTFLPKATVTAFVEAGGAIKVNAENQSGNYFYVKGFYYVA